MQKLVCCMFALTLLISGCSKEQSQAPTSVPPPEVGVTTLAYENLNSVTRYPGRTKVLQQIDLVPEVAGIIIAQHFQEGQKVKRGETLYELDPEPLEAEVQQQTHRLAQAQPCCCAGCRKPAIARSP